MKSRWFILIVSIIMIVALVVPACSTSTSTAPASPETIELKLSTFVPPVVWFIKEKVNPWIEQLEERSNGKVKIKVFPSGSLGTLKDHYNMLLARQADICQVDIGATPGVFPLSEGISLPLIFSSSEAANSAWWELSEKYLMDTEFGKVKVLWHNCIPPSQIHTANKPVHTLDDLKGLKLALTQAAQIATLEQLGAAPVFIPITEMYTAMERGMVDGTMLCWEAATVFKIFEVTKYRTAAKINTSLTTFMMNRDSYNSLPPDIQQFIDETTGLSMSQSFGSSFDKFDLKQLNEVMLPYDKEKGNPEIYNLPDDEIAKWSEAVEPVVEEWITEREDKGLPAQAFYDDMLQIAAKYNK